MTAADRPATDWPDLYRRLAAAVSALTAELDDATLARPVPGTPAWDVAGVVAHLAGVASDTVTGRTDGAPGEEWTARHVAERRDRPTAENAAELAGHADVVAGTLAGQERPAAVWDLAVHHADLHEALGLGTPPAWSWEPVADALAPRLRRLGVDRADVDDYELFRAVFSRRSRAQVRALLGDGPDDEALDAFPVFGPRDDDQPVPGPHA